MEHQNTISATGNITFIYSHLGYHANAVALISESTEVARTALGEGNVTTLESLDNLCACYINWEKLDEASEIMRPLVGRNKRVLGVEHCRTLALIKRLAWVYSSMERHQDAFELQEELLAIQQQRLGADDSSTLDVVDAMINTIGGLQETEKMAALVNMYEPFFGQSSSV